MATKKKAAAKPKKGAPKKKVAVVKKPAKKLAAKKKTATKKPTPKKKSFPRQKKPAAPKAAAPKPVSLPVEAKPILPRPLAPVSRPLSLPKGSLIVPKTAPSLALKPAPAALPVLKPAIKPLAIKPATIPVLKPAASAPVAVAAPKAAKAPKEKVVTDPNDYRNLRKYTHLKLTEVATALAVEHGLTDVNELPYGTLLEKLVSLEAVVNDWKKAKMPLPNGQKRKRGRPSKAELAARANQVQSISVADANKKVADLKARFAPKPMVLPKPVGTNGIVKPLAPKLVAKTA